MELEVQLLNEQRPQDIETFVEERTMLSTIYSQEMLLIKPDRSLINGITRDLKDRLREATAKFQATLAAHQLVLQRLKSILERIIKAVSDEVTRTRTPNLGYGTNALLNATPATASLPLALNQIA